MSGNHNKTVLVVEDQDEITEKMNAVLTGKGYRVLHAIDADGALKIAEQTPPLLILTDLDLPTLSQLMDRLRAHRVLQEILVAVIDINHPPNLRADLKVLHNFDELDQLLSTADS